MTSKHEKLIDDLITKTESGDVRWGPTDAEDQFVLKLKSGAILLEKTQILFVNENFVITILNNEGVAIDRISLLAEPYRSKVAELFNLIDRRISRIDEQIDEIIGELETL